jgi:hypothetical protein
MERKKTREYLVYCGQCAKVAILTVSIISTNLTDLRNSFNYFYKNNYCSSIYVYIKICFQSEHINYAVCTAIFSIICNSLFSSHTAKFRIKNNCSAKNVITVFIFIKKHTGNISSEKNSEFISLSSPWNYSSIVQYPSIPSRFGIKNENIPTTWHSPVNEPKPAHRKGTCLSRTTQHSRTVHIYACPERKPSSRIICQSNPEQFVTVSREITVISVAGIGWLNRS